MLQLNSPYYVKGLSVYYKFDIWRIKTSPLNRSACSCREQSGKQSKKLWIIWIT